MREYNLSDTTDIKYFCDVNNSDTKKCGFCNQVLAVTEFVVSGTQWQSFPDPSTTILQN